MIASAIKRLFATDPAKHHIHDVYLKIVAQARSPVFYTDWQVDDTIDGRFDMIVLHLFLIVSRCEENGEFCRQLTEVFFSDMDRSLREMGVGDTGVSVRIKKMAQAFFGRIKAYTESLHDDKALAEALRRNVWRENPKSTEAVASLVAYMRANHQALQSQPVDELMLGRIIFSD